MSVIETRVRRPDAHEELIQRLRGEAGFPTMRDVLLFAAGVGLAYERRVPFEKSGEPIRYDTLTAEALSESFISMLAAVEISGDPEVLDVTRLPERVTIFEEYANGGLEVIQEQVNTRREPLEVVVRSLVTDALSDAGHAKPASIEDLLA